MRRRWESTHCIPFASNEIAINLAKRDARIYEVPISYAGRTYAEGKKINWKAASPSSGTSSIQSHGMSGAPEGE